MSGDWCRHRVGNVEPDGAVGISNNKYIGRYPEGVEKQMTLSNADKLRFAEVEDRITREFGDSDTMDFLTYLERLKDNNHDTEKLQGDNDDLSIEIGNLEQEIDELEDTIEELEDKIASLEKEICELEDTLRIIK